MDVGYNFLKILVTAAEFRLGADPNIVAKIG